MAERDQGPRGPRRPVADLAPGRVHASALLPGRIVAPSVPRAPVPGDRDAAATPGTARCTAFLPPDGWAHARVSLTIRHGPGLRPDLLPFRLGGSRSKEKG